MKTFHDLSLATGGHASAGTTIDQKVGKKGFNQQFNIPQFGESIYGIKNDIPLQFGDTLLNPGTHKLSLNKMMSKKPYFYAKTKVGDTGNVMIVSQTPSRLIK